MSRPKGSKNKTSVKKKTVVRKQRTQKTFVVQGKGVYKMPPTDNPFKIKSDLEYSGNRSDIGLVNALLEQAVKLDATNRKESLSIPLTICSNRSSASNLFLQMRRLIIDMKTYKHMVFTSRGIFSSDGKKSYLGSRIWRIK